MAKTSAETVADLLNRLRSDIMQVCSSFPEAKTENSRLNLIQEQGVARLILTFVETIISIQNDGTLGERDQDKFKITPFGTFGEPELTVTISTTPIGKVRSATIDGDQTNMYFPDLPAEQQNYVIIANVLMRLVQSNIDFIIEHRGITTLSRE